MKKTIFSKACHILIRGWTVSGLIIFLFLVFPSTASSRAVLDDRIMISSSPNPVGSGARAIGMGGAFIAIADDATAASWNPGGLIQLETPEISCVGTFVQRYEDTYYTAFPDASEELDVNDYKLNYFSLAYPFNVWDRNMTISLNHQHMFNFDKITKLEFNSDFTTYSSTNTYQLEQDGDLYTISPAYAVQVTPSLSLGFTLNLWKDSINTNSWRVDYSEEIIVQRPSGSFESKVSHADVYEFDGVNYHFGFLWDINQMFTLGGVFKSEFEAGLKHQHYYRVEQNNRSNTTVSTFDEKMNMPMSFGLGFSVRFSDAFSVGFDIYRTLWEDYYIITSTGKKISPITGKDLDETSIDPTTQMRVGMEYLFIGKKMVIPIRAGLFYDPEPSDGSPDDFYGMSLGSGLVYKNFVFDCAYQYRFGRDVRQLEIGGSSSAMDVDEHYIYFSLIYHL